MSWLRVEMVLFGEKRTIKNIGPTLKSDSNCKLLLEIIHREQSVKLQPVLQEYIALGVNLVPAHLYSHSHLYSHIPDNWQ